MLIVWEYSPVSVSYPSSSTYCESMGACHQVYRDLRLDENRVDVAVCKLD